MKHPLKVCQLISIFLKKQVLLSFNELKDNKIRMFCEIRQKK
jgi:hypothetical protein